MGLSTQVALYLGLLAASTQVVVGLGAGDADTMFNDFNKAFLVSNGTNGSPYYKTCLDNGAPDNTWQGSLDILVAEDAYDRTGRNDTKALVNSLLTTWLNNNPPPWDWDGWNDDIGWFTLALIRGYQITSNDNFLTQARYGFDYAYGRGWDTQYNGGGIWEQNPSYMTSPATKEALSNDSLGKVACLIYQSNGDQWYLDRCKEIFAWVESNIYNAGTGQINTGIAQDGTVDTGAAAYNQGTFLDYANLLHKITGDSHYYAIADKAMYFASTCTQMSTNGILSRNSDSTNTWADELARGAGNFVSDNNRWADYYSWMVDNANSILANRRSDYGITWNAWDQPTDSDNSRITNQFASAAAWLQYVPASQPKAKRGIRTITNSATGVAINSAEHIGKRDLTPAHTQRWQLSQNSDQSWNIVNPATWRSLESANGRTVQSRPSRSESQRWWVDEQADGSFTISNKATGMPLVDGFFPSRHNADFYRRGETTQRWEIV